MQDVLGTAKSIKQMKEICQTLKERIQKDIEENGEPTDSTVIPYWRCQPYIRSNPGVKRTLDEMKEDEERSKEVAKVRQMKKALKKQKVRARSERTWSICAKCQVNPKGLKCSFDLCRICCRIKANDVALGCRGHRIKAACLKEDESTSKETNNLLVEEKDVNETVKTEQLSS
ncbi:tRNA-dihydrouridine(16/17) synthase [NAD(P)(+)]-like protein [Desmophyllum pertusum]|uniref:tRNA-dihydrouridine(16/17) synthase [NAD(P)(+)]-like protein n=1 Tax=Desmophyllum pertusum TaxID=174260 RepID=A0A9W9YGS2_9CNID|nr:tRNA-dihydrouridine(16/17) synthase [NAD(P)(+)]-like protein [Desmophyllum pertusum]